MQRCRARQQRRSARRKEPRSEAFLFEGTEAQSRALVGLKWLVKAGQLDYDFSAYDFRGQPQREARQAAVAEPPMLALLERQIEQLYNSRNP